MNNTYFYQVQIGKYTRSGNLQSHVAFVCMSAEKNQYKISEHYQKVYKGFDVLVIPVTEIVEVQPVSEKLESVSSEQSQLAQKVKELREENAILKKEQSVSYIYGKIDLQQVPNIDDSRAIMKECMVTYNKEKRKIKNEVDAVIRQKYGKLIHSVNIDDFSEESREFSFNCSLSITLKYKGNQ